MKELQAEAKCEGCGTVTVDLKRVSDGTDSGESDWLCSECRGSNLRPLLGEWRHANGMLFCGTLRIARADFDTNPSGEFSKEVFDWICKRLNAHP